ncbi:MAG: YHYH protein, partial [Verrucomicrobiota bacterium]
HVQPTGNYHYHGLPTGYLDRTILSPDTHSPLIGWAVDGFPIYALYGYALPNDPSSAIVELQASYQLQNGRRPTGSRNPGGSYDGTFTRDYEFVAGLGDLDECNGRFCLTPDFPDGTYAYFLTEEYPVIPRFWRGTPQRPKRAGPEGPPSGKGRPPGPKGFGPPKGPPPPRF